MKLLNKKKFRLIGAVQIAFITIFETGCKKFVDVEPPTSSITSINAFQSNATAASVLTGIYSTMGSAQFIGGPSGVSLTNGLLADELFLYPGATGLVRNYFENTMTANNSQYFGPWREMYTNLARVNGALEGLNASTALNSNLRKQLIGEVLFLRAFDYFYLVTLYGDVPLQLTSNWQTNSTGGRTPKADVWKQVIEDLKSAKDLLSDDYLMPDGLTKYSAPAAERVRPTKWAAKALLARVYLYNGQWQLADAESSDVIAQAARYKLETSLSAVFLKNSTEAIWQMMPVLAGQNTPDALAFNLAGTSFASTRPAYIPTFLYDSFQVADKRRTTWIGTATIAGKSYYYPAKYIEKTLNAPISEYTMVLRLAEQYLIRAEAKGQQNLVTDGLADLNQIRHRAGLEDTAITDSKGLVDAVLNERRFELFTEWGHRWADLKRTGQIDKVMEKVTPLKANGKLWQSYQQLLPLNTNDLRYNPNLGPNNPGY